MKLYLNNIPSISSLRFGRYIPKRFLTSNPFLGSWVSPLHLNFNNLYRGADLKTLSGRLKGHAEKDFHKIIKTAFKQGWFTWKLINKEQVLLYEKKQFDNDFIKILTIKFDLALFKHKDAYSRLLSICAVVEFFSLIYKDKLRIMFTVFDQRLEKPKITFSKYSQKYKSYYLTLNGVGQLAALVRLDKIYRLGRNKQV